MGPLINSKGTTIPDAYGKGPVPGSGYWPPFDPLRASVVPFEFESGPFWILPGFNHQWLIFIAN